MNGASRWLEPSTGALAVTASAVTARLAASILSRRLFDGLVSIAVTPRLCVAVPAPDALEVPAARLPADLCADRAVDTFTQPAPGWMQPPSSVRWPGGSRQVHMSHGKAIRTDLSSTRWPRAKFSMT